MGSPYNFSTGEVIQEFSYKAYSGLLVANVAQSLEVPGFSTMGRSTSGSQNKVIMEIKINAGNNTVWVSNAATAAVPGGAIAASDSEAVPAEGILRKVVTIGDTLSFITSGTSVQLSIAFYQSL